MQFLTVLKYVAILVAMMIPGFVLVKSRLIKENSTNILTVLLLYVTQPFVTANSFLSNSYSPRILKNILLVVIFVTVFMLLTAVIANYIFFKDRLKFPEKKRVFTFASTFGNIGYMCLPFLMVMMPDNQEIILYAAVSIVVFNILAWTVGSFILTGEKKYISFKKAVFNSPTVAFLLIFPLFLFNINYETSNFLDSLKSMISMTANMTTPLAMILIGIKLAGIKPKEFFGDYRVYLTCFIKLLMCPLLAFGMVSLMSLFVDVSGVRLNLIALASMPTATNTVMFSELYSGDVKSATKIVLTSTIVSIITIPFVLWLFV